MVIWRIVLFPRCGSSLVSCHRSSSHSAADVGDKQATENKVLVSRTRAQPNMTNFWFGTLP